MYWPFASLGAYMRYPQALIPNTFFNILSLWDCVFKDAPIWYLACDTPDPWPQISGKELWVIANPQPPKLRNSCQMTNFDSKNPRDSFSPTPIISRLSSRSQFILCNVPKLFSSQKTQFNLLGILPNAFFKQRMMFPRAGWHQCNRYFWMSKSVTDFYERPKNSFLIAINIGSFYFQTVGH